MDTSLNIAIIGYGRMGQMIEQIAISRGHVVKIIIDQDKQDLISKEGLEGVDVAIEFTHPNHAERICHSCLNLGIPVVSGTTGWPEGVERLKQVALQLNGSFFWSSNYSVGVHLFNYINRLVAQMMNTAPDYRLSLSETHHIHKHDAPSGTAITLAEQIIGMRTELNSWKLVADEGDDTLSNILPITSIRLGEVPGIHSVIYQSEVDKITLTHEAFGRNGFALGAILAAEYTARHQGVHTMDDLIQLSTYKA